MKWIEYSRYTGEDLGIDADDLLKALADFLLQSGYPSEWNQHTLENLRQAIQQALENGLLDRAEDLTPEQMDQLLDRHR